MLVNGIRHKIDLKQLWGDEIIGAEHNEEMLK